MLIADACRGGTKFTPLVYPSPRRVRRSSKRSEERAALRRRRGSRVLQFVLLKWFGRPASRPGERRQQPERPSGGGQQAEERLQATVPRFS